MNRRISAAVLTALLAVSLCGCGSAGGGASSAASGGAGASAASSSAGAGAAQSLQSENEQLQTENRQLKEQLASAQSGGTSTLPESGNPIDTFFAPYDAAAETTYDMAAVGSAEYEAWHDELTAFVKDMEGETSDAQDKEDLEDYLENAEEQAQILTQMVYLEGAGADTPRDQRAGSAGTLAPVSVARSGAENFKDAFYSLYNIRYAQEADWTWHFDAAAAKTALDAQLAKG